MTRLRLGFLLATSWLPLYGVAQSTTPGRTVERLSVAQAHALWGKLPGTFPDTYRALGATVAYRNRWREADADYDTDVTIGLRFGLGKSTRTGYAPGNRSVETSLRGLNPFVAADGRYFGAALGAWLGKLGRFRGSGTVHVVPQVRVRAGRLDGWHAQIDYAEELLGFGNPPARLGGGTRLPGTPLTVLVGAAIPTAAAEGSEVQAFARVGLRLGRTFEASSYAQPRFSAAAPTQLGFSLGYVP
ncbi:hypothetical protein GCM10027048_21930 [Hymenobacter coalescens]